MAQTNCRVVGISSCHFDLIYILLSNWHLTNGRFTQFLKSRDLIGQGILLGSLMLSREAPCNIRSKKGQQTSILLLAVVSHSMYQVNFHWGIPMSRCLLCTFLQLPGTLNCFLITVDIITQYRNWLNSLVFVTGNSHPSNYNLSYKLSAHRFQQ